MPGSSARFWKSLPGEALPGAAHEAKHLTRAQIGQKDLSPLIDAKGANEVLGVEELDLLLGAVQSGVQGPDLTGAEVSEEVAAPHRRRVVTSIYVSAGHGAVVALESVYGDRLPEIFGVAAS